MKILVLGSGQIATAVAAASPPGQEIIVSPRASLDITDAAAVTREVTRIKADWIINAAAYTAVDQAEDEPGKAREVNDTAVAALVAAAAGEGSRLLHLSTD